MLSINNLSFSYKRRPLFNQLELHLEPGKIYGLLGKNGVGKTTLLKLISTLLYPHEGQIRIKDMDSRKRHPLYLSSFYLIPEEFDLPQLKMTTYVDSYAPFYPNFDLGMFYRIVKDFELDEKAVLTRMSYGQKKKFLIAFGLATNTPILLMDEPTNGLDIPSKAQFRRTIAENLDDSRIVMISTHQVKDVEGLIDDVIILQDGVIIFQGNITDINEHITAELVQHEPTGDDNVIYYEPVLGGYLALMKVSDDHAPRRIDLELLFNAVINKQDVFKQIFKN